MAQRRYSFPMHGRVEDEVIDPFFGNQLTRIKNAIIEEQYRDNCYAEVKVEVENTKG